MEEWTSRTERLLGAEALEKLKKSRAAVFGVGGVGGFVVEGLVRSGIGALDLIDSDRVCESNLNRQIIATRETLGRYKVDVAAERIHAINPACEVKVYRMFYLPDTADQFDFSQYDYIVDAIDTVTGKLDLALRAQEAGVPIISAMGAGNKLDPTAFEVADIYETSVCPLAKVMRRECKKRGIRKLKVVYSREPALSPTDPGSEAMEPGSEPMESSESREASTSGPAEPARASRRSTPGSVSFVPSVAGLIIAGEVVKDLVGTVPGEAAGKA